MVKTVIQFDLKPKDDWKEIRIQESIIWQDLGHKNITPIILLYKCTDVWILIFQ